MCAGVYVWVVCMHVRVYVCRCVYIVGGMCMCVCMYMCGCMCVWCVCMYVCVCICVVCNRLSHKEIRVFYMQRISQINAD